MISKKEPKSGFGSREQIRLSILKPKTDLATIPSSARIQTQFPAKIQFYQKTKPVRDKSHEMSCLTIFRKDYIAQICKFRRLCQGIVTAAAQPWQYILNSNLRAQKVRTVKPLLIWMRWNPAKATYRQPDRKHLQSYWTITNLIIRNKRWTDYLDPKSEWHQRHLRRSKCTTHGQIATNIFAIKKALTAFPTTNHDFDIPIVFGHIRTGESLDFGFATHGNSICRIAGGDSGRSFSAYCRNASSDQN